MRRAPAVLLALTLAGCGGSMSGPAAPLTEPTALCLRGQTRACRPATEIEVWLAEPALEILGASGAPQGKQKAKVLTVALSRGDGRIVFRAKWRAHSTSHALNVPRRELAAHAVQRLFLDPEDFVVPVSAAHCFPLGPYRARVERAAAPTFAGTSCVFGIMSYWLEGGIGVEEAQDDDLLESQTLLDEARLGRDASYRRSLANVNLLLHLIDHGDSHRDQFVLTRDSGGFHVHAVDNTIAFGNYRNPRIKSRDDWSRLKVPALPRSSVERLRALRRSDLDALLVIEELEKRGGLLLPTRRSTPPRRSEAGLRWSGSHLQVGLTTSEIDRLWLRVRGVVERVDRHELRLEP